MPKPLHIVLTTINVPLVVRDLAHNAQRFGRLDQAKVWIIGDVKTPAGAATVAREASEAGLETIYLDIAAQEAMGPALGPFYNRLPINNECRRNIGYLAALGDGCEVLLAIDDDNFPLETDFIGAHRACGANWSGPLANESSGFFNVCEQLEIQPVRPIFPRGFPFRLRTGRNERRQSPAPEGVRIGVRAGLWLGDPDIDATTWLNGAVRGTRHIGEATTVLSQETWSPINTQNTSVVRDLVPAFLCVPMGWDVPGGKIQRYGDIWGGYFLQSVLQGTPYHVAFGEPLVDHRRNPHDYLDDLRGEYWGILLTDWLVQLLRAEFIPESVTITDRITELGAFLERDGVTRLPTWCPPEVRGFLEWTGGNLTAWAEACRRVSS